MKLHHRWHDLRAQGRSSTTTTTLTLTAVLFLVALAAEFASAATESDCAAEAVAELRFRDFFKMPVGARGLEPAAQLSALDGQTVRIRGYVVRQAEPTPGLLILSPLPVELGDADESLSDDLPPAVVFAHYDGVSLDVSGVVQVTGTLELGPYEEADGHVSQVRLHLSPIQAAEIARVSVPVAAASVTTPGRSQ